MTFNFDLSETDTGVSIIIGYMKEEESNIVILDEVVISKIYVIRDKKVMLDKDLADLFNIKAIRLREQVKRNQEKFPEHFMYQLTIDEAQSMVSQNAIPSRQHLGGALPYVFTEHGVLQLSNVLNSKRAVKVSIKIIEVFIKMRELLSDKLNLKLEIKEIKKKLENQDKNIELVFNYLDELIEKQENPEPRPRVGYKRKSEEH